MQRLAFCGAVACVIFAVQEPTGKGTFAADGFATTAGGTSGESEIDRRHAAFGLPPCDWGRGSITEKASVASFATTAYLSSSRLETVLLRQAAEERLNRRPNDKKGC
jgi:hypothetical protein